MSYELLTRYSRAKSRRTAFAIVAGILGVIAGAIVTRDAGMSMGLGLFTALIIGIWKSREVNRLEKIIYPGGK